jgi:general stress protein YciG
MAHENLNQQNHGGGRDQGSQDSTQPTPGKKGRGFASMDPEKQREIASKGGRAAHEKGTAHQFSADEAREAGRKGGGTVSRDRHHMAEIGRVGGQARGRKQRANASAEGSTPASTEEPSNDGGSKRPSGYEH